MASIRQKGLVVDHTEEAILTDCVFTVSEKSRTRVVQNFRKNVHALVKFKEYVKESIESLEGFSELYYNPYFTQYFMCLETGMKVGSAEQVIFKDNKVYAKNIKRVGETLC